MSPSPAFESASSAAKLPHTEAPGAELPRPELPRPELPLVDVPSLLKAVGPTTMARATAYARGGHVLEFDWDAAAGELTSRVQGGEEEPYECIIRIRHTGGRDAYAGGWCSCPVGTDCKHMLATVLAANEQTLRSRMGLAAAKGDRAPSSAKAPAWRTALDEILAPSAAGRAGARRPRAASLGIQFELRDLDAHKVKKYGRAFARQHREGTKLGIRPVSWNAQTKRWLRGNLSWQTFSRPDAAGEYDPAHFRLLQQLYPLHHASGSYYWRPNDPWIYLDDFASQLLWAVLADAQAAGIELIAGRGGAEVVCARSAEIGLDVSAADDGAITLAPTLSFEGEGLPAPAAAIGAISDHGAFAVMLRGKDEFIVIGPTARLLTDRERALLGQPAPIEVPAPDRAAFLTELYPDLARTLAVASGDGSIELPPVEPPVLVLTGTFEPRDRLRIAWHWEYRTGDDVRQAPLYSSAGERQIRDEAAEAAVIERVAAALEDSVLGRRALGDATLADLDTADFAERTIPELRAVEGVDVVLRGEQPDYRRLDGAPELVLSAIESEKRDWFDLGLMISIEGRQIAFQDVFVALAKGRTKVMLPDKSWFRIDTPEILKLKELIETSHELREWRVEGGTPKPPQLSLYQAGLWDEIAEIAGETIEPPRWRETVRGLLDPGALEAVPVPSGLAAELRPYQSEGFQWLAFLWRHGLGGVLADDMGLGKTLQTIALFLHAREAAGEATGPAEGETRRRPFLVVAPTSVVPNWAAEVARFAPSLRTVAVTDTEAAAGTPLSEATVGADVVVTSYALFRLDIDAYAALEWDGIVMDEAQFLKNRATKAHQYARDFDAPFKLALTGTPLENNLMELWSLFAIVAPGLFPGASHFGQEFARPIEKGGDAARLGRLRRRVRPLMLRRTKEAVARDLPEKVEQRLDVDLSPQHRRLYEQYLQREREKVLGLVEDLDRNRFIVFRSLTLLRLMALDPSLVDSKLDGVSPAKLDVLLEQLDDVIAEGHRALIFSQFTSFLKRAGERLAAEGVEFAYLDGTTKRRGDVVRAFKEGTAPVFLISLKAGGFGLNLTEADYCFLLDPWWNPAAEAQAVDRTHRIGQTRTVMTYRLVARGTIEEKVMELKEKKAALFTSVMDDDALFASALTADDVRSLLE
ncbi:DEAD/DEAH box helicase [Sinomonas sp. ASV322]|uniref:DEAD/DEAH box helicase n=1 Tax=Sinomonas sp. ASV322 TaxID=3041920 RepID=UPI0027DBF223|nr:DEAD/DEAH box helicase [Sinomonas sp. ASV322]MDQ4504201.1 DEAD/DEAH box helicase [Sinomonas sp. ASV322]